MQSNLKSETFSKISNNESQREAIKGALSFMNSNNQDFKNSKYQTNFLPRFSKDNSNITSMFFNSGVQNNDEVFEDFKNSKGIEGSGLAPMASLLARQIGFVIDQKYYEGNESSYVKGDQALTATEQKIDIRDIVPRVQEPKYAFLPTAYYQTYKEDINLSLENLGRGFTNEFGATPQTDGYEAGYQYTSKPVSTKGRALEYSFNQLSFERDRLLGIDGVTETIKIIKKQVDLEMAHLVMSGSMATGNEEKGLLNCDAYFSVDSTNSSATDIGFVANKQIDAYTNAEIKNFCAKIKSVLKGSLTGRNQAWKNPVLIVPADVFDRLNVQGLVEFNSLQMSYAKYILSTTNVQAIISSRSAMVDDPFNPHQNKNVVQLMDLSKDVIFMYDIIPFSLYVQGNSQAGLFTGNGVDLKATFVEQYVFPYVIQPERIIRVKI